jgi:hypothetical protein
MTLPVAGRLVVCQQVPPEEKAPAKVLPTKSKVVAVTLVMVQMPVVAKRSGSLGPLAMFISWMPTRLPLVRGQPDVVKV